MFVDLGDDVHHALPLLHDRHHGLQYDGENMRALAVLKRPKRTGAAGPFIGTLDHFIGIDIPFHGPMRGIEPPTYRGDPSFHHQPCGFSFHIV